MKKASFTFLIFLFLSPLALSHELPETPPNIKVADKSHLSKKIHKFMQSLYPLDMQNSKGDTAAHLIVRYGSVLDMRALRGETLFFSKRFDINKTNHEGLTPLHLATTLGRYDLISDIVKMGADLSIEYEGKKAIDFAKELVIRKTELALKKAFLERIENEKVHALLGEEGMTARKLKASGLDLSRRQIGLTPLEETIIKGDIEGFKTLIEADVISPPKASSQAIRITDPFVLNLLNLAWSQTHAASVEIIMILLAMDERTYFEKIYELAQSIEAKTALKENKEVGKVSNKGLLRYGVRAEQVALKLLVGGMKTNQGIRSRLKQTGGKNKEQVKFVVQVIEGINKENDKEQLIRNTPLLLEQDQTINKLEARFIEINEMDKKYRAKQEKALIPEIVDLLVEEKLHIDARNFQGDTLLLLAIQYEKNKIALELIDRGADITIVNDKGQRALLEAEKRGNQIITRRLKKIEAELNCEKTVAKQS